MTHALLVALLLASIVAFSAGAGKPEGTPGPQPPNQGQGPPPTPADTNAQSPCNTDCSSCNGETTCMSSAQNCTWDAGNCTAAVASAGNDPVFDGFDGSRYYVRCEANKTYALVSVPGTQVNIRTTTGLEEDVDILWISSIGFKVGNFTLTLKMLKDSSYFAGNPNYKIMTNGEDTTERLHCAQEYLYGDVRVYYLEQELKWQRNATDQNGNHCVATGVPLIDVFTPYFKFQVHMVTETRPSSKHLASPRFDIVSTILTPVEPTMAAGLLGESLSWNGSAPFMRGYLAGPDSAYEVNSLLEHDFKLDSDMYSGLSDSPQGGSYDGQYGNLYSGQLARDLSRPSTKRALAAGLPAHDSPMAMGMVGRSAGTGLLVHR